MKFYLKLEAYGEEWTLTNDVQPGESAKVIYITLPSCGWLRNEPMFKWI